MGDNGPLVVGIDGGGTSTRVGVADLDGTICAEARGPGVNPNSGGDPRLALCQTLQAALDELDPKTRGRIRGGVAGLAGAVTNRTLLSAIAEEVWAGAGLSGPIRVVSDLVVAFWSGFTPRETQEISTGRVLIAGTGAVAAAVQDFELVALSDGYGYLLGDRGGGVWLGIEATRAALDGASGRGPATVLTDLIIGDQDPMDIVAQAYRGPARDLGRLAPYVDRAIEAGDEVALSIARRALQELRLTLDSLTIASGSGGSPVVLVGSIAAGDNPIGCEFRAELTASGTWYRRGTTGVSGAVSLAARQFWASQ